MSFPRQLVSDWDFQTSFMTFSLFHTFDLRIMLNRSQKLPAHWLLGLVVVNSSKWVIIVMCSIHVNSIISNTDSWPRSVLLIIMIFRPRPFASSRRDENRSNRLTCGQERTFGLHGPIHRTVWGRWGQEERSSQREQLRLSRRMSC